MPKKCSSCGFSDNPDNAHYCGKCGKDIDIYGRWNVYNATRWRIYDPNRHAIIDRDKLKEYEELVRYKQLSTWKKMGRIVEELNDVIWNSAWTLLIFIPILFGIGFGIAYGINYVVNILL